LRKASKTSLLRVLTGFLVVGTLTGFLPINTLPVGCANDTVSQEAIRLGKLAAREKNNGATRDSAMRHIEQALRLQPANHWLLYEKADILLKMEEDAEALKYIDQAIRISPSTSHYWSLKANLLRYRGRKEEALAAADQAAKLAPSDSDALAMQGKILFELKRYREAEAVFDTHLKLYPHGEVIRSARIIACKAQGKWQKVIDDATICLAAQKGKPIPTFGFLLHRADAYEQTKQYEKAVADCQVAAKSFQYDREPHKRLIRLYTLMGDKKRAAEEVKALREIDEDMSPPVN